MLWAMNADLHVLLGLGRSLLGRGYLVGHCAGEWGGNVIVGKMELGVCRFAFPCAPRIDTPGSVAGREPENPGGGLFLQAGGVE